MRPAQFPTNVHQVDGSPSAHGQRPVWSDKENRWIAARRIVQVGPGRCCLDPSPGGTWFC